MVRSGPDQSEAPRISFRPPTRVSWAQTTGPSSTACPDILMKLSASCFKTLAPHFCLYIPKELNILSLVVIISQTKHNINLEDFIDADMY